MDKMKKMARLILVLVMVLAMAVPAMADSVVNNTSGHSYDAYQIFKGTQAENNDELADIEWGSGVDADALLATLKSDYDYFDSCATAKDVAAVLAGKADNCAEAKALANAAAKHLTDKEISIAADATSVELAAGYYLLVDTSSLEGDNKVDAHNSALLQVTNKGDVTISKKYDVPTVEKKINENGQLVDVADKNIGDTVDYVLTGTVAENYDDYDTYQYIFHDTLSAGLTLNKESIKVYVRNKADGSEDDKETEITSNAQIVTENLTDGCTFEVRFDDLKKIQGVNSSSKIVVKYNAVLNENALIDQPNPNKIKLEYSNNPNFVAGAQNPEDKGPTGITPEDIVEVYTTEVHIKKVDNNGNVLTGATFQITGETVKQVLVKTYKFTEDANGEYWKLTDGTYTKDDPTTEGMDISKYDSTEKKYTMTVEESVKEKTETVEISKEVGEDGRLTFAGLAEGTYTIKEIVTPAGYNTIADITLKIEFNDTDKTFSYSWSGGATSNTNTITVVNVPGSKLPETGGMGTTLFYVVGGALVAGAVVVMLLKKRNAA